jgi:competence protein ComEC
MRVFSRPRQPCVGFALIAAAAIFISDFAEVNSSLLLALLVVLAAGSFFVVRLAWPLVFVGFFLLHQFNHHHDPAQRLARLISSEPQPVTAIGIIVDEPDISQQPNGETFTRFPLRLEQISIGGVGRRSDATVIVHLAEVEPSYGDRIKITGAIWNIPPPRNPAQFDKAAYMARQNIFSEIRVRYPQDATLLGSGHGNIIIAAAIETRNWLKAQIDANTADSPEVSAVLHGMLLGLKHEATPGVEEAFRFTGTLHLFAVSGLHVAMFALIVWAVVKPIGLGRSRSILLVIGALAFYATVTGLRASGLRAAIMAAAVLGGYLFDRRALAANGLSAAAVALLTWDTNQLFAPGFQLSFGVVAAILAGAAALRRIMLRLAAPDPFLPRILFTRFQVARSASVTALASLLSVSTAAWGGSLPLTLYYFHLVAPITVVANLFLVPLSFIVLALGTINFVCSTFSSWLASVFSSTNWLMAHVILAIAELFADVPGAYVHLGPPALLSDTRCEITVLDLGAGAAIHIRSDGKDWLIDTGNERQRPWLLDPYLRSRGIDRLDGLMLTHGDVAHIGAASAIVADFKPDTIIDSAVDDRSATRREFHRTLAHSNRGKSICATGDSIMLSADTCVRVLYPPAGIYPRAADDKAFVLQLECKGTRVLFTSDSGFFTEQWLRSHNIDVRSDLLVKNQHVSDFAATADFLAEVNPQAVISAAAALPESARISRSWERELEARGICLFRQDKTGAVTVRISSGGSEISAFMGGQTFRTRRR